ncbi:hypothetical protein [Sphingosinicella sp. BN140058]|uniref:hypothetical protein n=1 Tax=Sphingosinicella sp. BN140058 TaxID=1892855 RepID=UPI0010103DED|nr:hypothetical protein [Sphingosinicella sp. BN140058]QAY78082.1 hypothetical protein ETR14_17305 [Sphingosinicella sp. BN140058]
MLETLWRFQKDRSKRRRRAGSSDRDCQLFDSQARSLRAMAMGAATAASDADARLEDLAGRIGALIDKPADAGRAPDDFSLLAAMEMELVRLLPKELKVRTCWSIRERFECIASPRAVERYRASRPPALSTADRLPEGGLALIEADAIALLGQINRIFLMNREGERTINDLQRWVGWSIVRDGSMFMAFVIATYVLLKVMFGASGDNMTPIHFSKLFLIGLITIMFMGYLGAAMSTVRRLQAAVGEGRSRLDPYMELAPLRFGRRGIRLGMISGSIFSLLLYFIFVSGAGEMLGIKGGIFPRPVETNAAQAPNAADDASAAAAPRGGPAIGRPGRELQGALPAARVEDGSLGAEGAGESDCDVAAGPSCGWFAKFAGRLGFAGPGDVFKMLIWAFVAGFAERLVPDAIDRLVSRPVPRPGAANVGGGNE